MPQSETKTKQTQFTSKKDIDENKGMAIIAYIIFFIPLLTDAKDSPFVKFHVKQSIMLLISCLIVGILGSAIPVIGWFLIGPIGSLVILFLWIIGLMHAINGEMKKIPLIGDLAEKYLKF